MKSKRKGLIAFGRPLIENDEIKEVVKTLKSGWITTGPKVAEFENLFKEYVGSKYALAVNSCTSGLHLALLVAGIRPGDEVITSPMTFAATANQIIHAGAVPVFADIDRNSMNIDPKEIEKKITGRTKAILPVHFAGRACDMDAILRIAKKYNFIILNDAAHAIETKYKGKNIGCYGNITVYSFHATKNITTGEGGMVTTNNKEYAKKIKMYGFHGINKDSTKRYSFNKYNHYSVSYPGYKYNMMDIQASLGIRQLKKIERYSRIRKYIWDKYNDAFKDLPCSTPKEAEPLTRHAYHLYNLLIDVDSLKTSRDRILNELINENIGAGVHYLALHLHEFYAKTFGYKRGDFPNAEYISDRTISLPLSPGLTNKNVNDIIRKVKKVLNSHKR
ncbi:MAG: DegT/DnrJ/EryC1/StrS aminotransferase family protein [Elusimicrobia bacterium]|nr:DegT/DnrJ/EryC1/StrS aminotransferase family protein [Candidatus Liberimonas magnetica]